VLCFALINACIGLLAHFDAALAAAQGMSINQSVNQSGIFKVA